MLSDITKTAATDKRASVLLGKARESAAIYLLVSKRQKGCDGMGELAMIREEFREAVDDLIRHCKGKECHSSDFGYDLDLAAAELSDDGSAAPSATLRC